MTTERHSRMSLSEVVERLTDRRGASSSVTLKMSAQGVFMPEVNIAAGVSDEDVDHMIDQAIAAYTRLHSEAAGVVPPKQTPAKDAALQTAKNAAAIATSRARSGK